MPLQRCWAIAHGAANGTNDRRQKVQLAAGTSIAFACRGSLSDDSAAVPLTGGGRTTKSCAAA
jgi:hypothetical protein